MKIICSTQYKTRGFQSWLTTNRIIYNEGDIDEDMIGDENYSRRILLSAKLSRYYFEISEDDFVFFLLSFAATGKYFNSRKYYLLHDYYF